MKKRDDGIDVQGKSPAFYFYPADWLRSMAPCSLAARGLWADCLCHLHFAKRRGYLEHPNGNPITEPELARMTGAQVSQIARCMAELERCGIFSKDDKSIVFNRRMVRDTEISLKRKEAGKAGGNPNLVGKQDKQKSDLDNQNPNQNPTLSLSPSPSLSLSPSGNTPTPLSESEDMVIRSKPAYQTDDTFTPFMGAYTVIGASVIEADWIAAHFEWKALDFEQKAEALTGVKRIKASDPAYIPKPQNYLKRREWTRTSARRDPIETPTVYWQPPTL